LRQGGEGGYDLGNRILLLHWTKAEPVHNVFRGSLELRSPPVLVEYLTSTTPL